MRNNQDFGVIDSINKTFNMYKNYIWSEIPKLTGVRWKIKSIELRFSSRTQNCFPESNRFVIGIRGFKKEWKRKVLCLIIHESIHLNTAPINCNLKGIKNRFNIVEIATCVLTNIMISKVNKKFHVKYPVIHFEEPYKKYEKFEPKLRKLFYQSKDYKDFLDKIKEQYFEKLTRKK